MPVSRKRQPTIDDVARRARVAKSTVSKALSPRAREGDISEATRGRIEAIAAAMGYQPEWKRRTAAMRRNRMIGLVFADYAPISGGVYADLAHALARHAVELGYNLAFVPVVGGADAWERRVRQQDPDGLVAIEPIPGDLAAILARLGRPAVVVNSLTRAAVTHLLPDEAVSARLLVGHLHALGHRRIAFAMERRDGRHYSERERQVGVAAAAAALGMTCTMAVTASERLHAEVRAGGATAAIAYNAADCLRLLHQTGAAGRRVPQDLSLCCWDNEETLRWSQPAITSVEPPVAAMAGRAIDGLIDIIEGRKAPAQRCEQERFPTRLLVRGSTAAV